MTQSTKTETHDRIREFEWRDGDKQPHWLRFGKGYADLRAKMHTGAGWLSLDTHEYNATGPRSAYKRTMITLDEPAARAFYAWLHERFGAPARLA